MSKGHGLLQRKDKKKGRIWWTFVYWHPVKKTNIRLSKEEFDKHFQGDKDVAIDEAIEFKKKFLSNLNALSIKVKQREAWRDKYHNFVRELTNFKNYRKNKSPNSWKNDAYFLEKYVYDFYLNRIMNNNVSTWHIHFDEFRKYLETDKTLKNNSQKHLAYSTKNHCIKSLNNFLTFMYRRNKVGVAPKCPMFEKHLINRKGAESLISKDEEQFVYDKLLSNCVPSAKLWRVLYHTGMRLNEALGLSLADVYPGVPNHEMFKKAVERYDEIKCLGYIVLDSQPSCHTVRDKITGDVPRKPLKGKKKIEPRNNRLIPILDKNTMNILVELLKEQRELWKQKKYGENQKDYLLFDGLNKSIFSNDLRDAYDGSAYKPHTAHDCRHTFCTNFAGMTEGNEFLCQNVLGHIDTYTTKGYLHLWEDIQRKVQTSKMLGNNDSWIDKWGS